MWQQFLFFWWIIKKTIFVADAFEKPSPELNATFLSRLFFTWFDPLIVKGFRKPLEKEDLYDLNPEDSIITLMPKWEKNWISKCSKNKGERTSVMIPLTKTFGWSFLEANLINVLYVVLTTVSYPFHALCNMPSTKHTLQFTPNVLSYLISFVTNDDETWKGYVYMILMVAVNMLKTLSQSQYFYKIMLIGMRIKSTLTTAIYEKGLKLSPSARKERTSKLLSAKVTV